MSPRGRLAGLLSGAAAIALMASAPMAHAEDVALNIAPQALGDALNEFAVQSKQAVVFAPGLVAQKTSRGVASAPTVELALAELLEGTGLTYRNNGSAFLIVKADAGPQSSGAAGDGAEVEALIVTAQKREEDIQDVPIAISAFTQEDLTRSQVAGGPDLMTQVPNFTFTKTNFSSYSIQIRGIGTQAVSATTDPAVAVAFNNTPFVRNRFFEQEFYDLARVEVLRGPQGTLYGRNATAGVVNILSAKPTFQYEARAAADLANYSSSRLEGMLNIPLVEDRLALRLAGAWTKREGYSTNQLTGNPIDGRNLWSGRASLRFDPTEWLRVDVVYEHFGEDDDRLRSGKQLCKKDLGPTEIGGVPVPQTGGNVYSINAFTSQGCLPTSLYGPEAFQTPNGFALPFYGPLSNIGAPVPTDVDPYISQTQSTDLRVIESTRDPEYRARSDLAQLQVTVDLNDELTLASETSYSADFLFSTQDFNRFNTKPGAFIPNSLRPGVLDENGVFCDPQLGCSDRLELADLSTARSRQFSQELRLSSDYDGPFNFSLGANYLRYDTEDKYYIFINSLSVFAANATWTGGDGIFDVSQTPYVPGVTDNMDCLRYKRPGDPNAIQTINGCIYIDPNPIGSLNDQGHNYFLSKNPYRLISYAVFGEVYYNFTPDLKLTAGLRYTVDKKHAPQVPSWLMVTDTYGYPVSKVIEQEWNEPTGRLTLDWKPALGFTDDTLLYASYAHGYKAGGANPPPPVIAHYGNFGSGDADVRVAESLTHPSTFDAEYVDAFEIGSKNTLFDGAVTLNFNAFYYDYKGYQISQIIDRSAVNSNFDVEVSGVEVEADWRPLENLRLGFKGGYQNTRVADGSRAIDLIDRTAGDPNYIVMRPFPTIPSNCIVPVWFASYGGQINGGFNGFSNGVCVDAYRLGIDPITGMGYIADPDFNRNGDPLPSPFEDYPGFNPASVPNNGEGIAKDLSGNELPNAPNYTATITADYTVPLPNEWLMTLHTDLYYQSEAWTRIFNMEGYDKLKAYTNVNLAAIFTNEDAGWKVMAYVKNVFDRDSITGAFLSSDDTGLTTNVFLTEPRLYGLRVTKEWSGDPIFGGILERKPRPADDPYPLTIELGAATQQFSSDAQAFRPALVRKYGRDGIPVGLQDEDLDWGDGREVKLTYRPDGNWSFSLGGRFGRTNAYPYGLKITPEAGGYLLGPEYPQYKTPAYYRTHPGNYGFASFAESEEHTIVDFMVGREAGIGQSAKSSSALSFGVRYAEFGSDSKGRLWGMPDLYMPSDNNIKYVNEFTRDNASIDARRSFKGVGPAASIEGVEVLFGDERTGEVAVEWSLSGAVLFGKQKASVEYAAQSHYFEGKYVQYQDIVVDTKSTARSLTRSKEVTAPVIGASLGLSYSLNGIKVSGGYRAERFFDVIDGGIDNARQFDRAVDGPFVKLSVGFGR